MMRNVALPDWKHSDRFGQRADSHTVCSPRWAMLALRASTAGLIGLPFLSHSGRRSSDACRPLSTP